MKDEIQPFFLFLSHFPSFCSLDSLRLFLTGKAVGRGRLECILFPPKAHCMFVHEHTILCMHMYVYAYVFVCEHMHMCMFECVFVCACVYVDQRQLTKERGLFG